MKKEILTKEKVKIDYFNQLKNNLFSLSLFPFFAIAFLIGTILIAKFISFISILYKILFICTASFVTIVSLLVVLDEIKIYYKVRRNEFYITTDTLITIEKKKGGRFYYTFNTQSYALSFAKHGTYHVVEGKLNTFSENFKINDDELYRSSNISDTFYLAICGEKIIFAYNQKFFELNIENPHQI